MQRNDEFRRISALVRGSHTAAMMAIGWLISDLTEAELERLRGFLEEVCGGSTGVVERRDHLTVVRERWGLPKP